MRLQLAMDVPEVATVMEVADLVYGIVDIFEVGTPVIMKYGNAPIRALKERYPEWTILADSKIMDGGSVECLDLVRAGADIVTVLAVSDNATISEVVETAHAYGREVMVDLMCVTDIAERSKELMGLGADYIAVHTAFDVQKYGRSPLKDLRVLVGAIDPAHAAVAGGVKQATISDYVAENPGIVIAGAALYGAPDVEQAAMDMKAALKV